MGKLKSIAIIGGGKKEDRNDHDFYPSPPDVTQALLDFLISEKIFFQNVWEPCCGDGAMSRVMESYGYDVYSTDLRSGNDVYGSGGINFITADNYYCDAVITNPPFNIAKEIIMKALENANIVCMLLKATYWHPQDRISLFMQHKPAYILPLTWRPDFNGGGNPTMDLSWTVWIKGNHGARYQILLRPEEDKSQLQLF